MNSLLGDLTWTTWTCHICNEERPEANISVLKRSLNIPGVIANENIRYCNDKPECIEGAKTFSFYKKMCDFCSEETDKLYSYPIPSTLETADICKKCFEEAMGMTVDELEEVRREIDNDGNND